MDKTKSQEIAGFITSCLDDGPAGKERLRKAMHKAMPRGIKCPVCGEHYIKLHKDGYSCIPCNEAMRYEEFEVGQGSITICQMDEWWPDNGFEDAYIIADSKRANCVGIRDSESYGRIVVPPMIEDVVPVGPSANKQLDKKIARRCMALCRKGCRKVVKFKRQRFEHGNELVEQYSILGLL